MAQPPCNEEGRLLLVPDILHMILMDYLESEQDILNFILINKVHYEQLRGTLIFHNLVHGECTVLAHLAGKNDVAMIESILDDASVEAAVPRSVWREMASIAREGGHVHVVESLLRRNCVRACIDEEARKIASEGMQAWKELEFRQSWLRILWKAIRSCQQDFVELFFSHGLTVELCDYKGSTALHLAAGGAGAGTATLVWLMLNMYGANPNKMMGRARMAPGLWNTPLNVAAAAGNTRVVEMLLEHGADPAYGEADGACQALGVAARQRHEDIVSILSQNKRIALNARLMNGATVLGLAVSSGKTDMVQMLLDNEGIDPNATMGNGKTPLMIAAQGPAYGGSGLAMTKLLLSDERVDTSLRDNSGANPLHLAARNDQAEVVDMYLKQGTFDPNEADAQGDTPVAGVGACEECLLAFVNDATVDLNLIGRSGFTLLMENIYFLRANHVEQLLESGRVNVNQRDNSGDTALMLACICWVDSSDCCKIVQALLQAPGVNVDMANMRGETALLYAVRSGGKDVVRMLLETGEAQVTLAVLQEASPGMLDLLYRYRDN